LEIASELSLTEKNARVILMKGPAGRYEDRKYMLGTKKLLYAMIDSKAYTIISGGNTLSAMKHLNISRDKIGHVSLAGGAFIEYLSGKKLPGLEALRI
jgi:phosphoglycerate kinase